MNLGATTLTNSNLSSSVKVFDIFPRHSVNLLTGPTSVGKTFFVTHIINHYKQYFVAEKNKVDRIFIVLCNERVQPVTLSPELDLPVEQVSLGDFQIDDLAENDLVLIDDVQHLTDTIRLALSVAVHHYNLASLFIVTHSLLGSQNFELLNYCHRIFLFMRAASNTRLTKYIIDHFYAERELKEYLKSVVEFCVKEKDILALELNRVAHQQSEQHFLGLSHLTQWTSESSYPYFLLYPMPMFEEDYSTHFKDSVAFDDPHQSPPDLPISELPKHTCIAVPAKVVKAAIADKTKDSADIDADKCAERNQWNQTALEIEENIEDFFPTHRWHHAKNLAREILKNPNVCVTVNGRYFHLLDKPTSKVNLISFIALVTRRAGPSEIVKKNEWRPYKMHVENLLRHDTPIEMITNKLLLPTKYH